MKLDLEKYKARGDEEDTPLVEQDSSSCALTDPLADGKLDLSDFYVDARRFLDKANSTKFILVAYVLLLVPVLLWTNTIAEDTFKEILLITTLTYLGVNVYEKHITKRKS